ncbi:SH3 domain-containing protein [Microaerobacter geothermalis]|uniref:SH3 domain-containing protein n=1 Tax=Microaerobacter geothermalis TaxID=674972 RepID=UPI001F1DFD86|nr:SH3 domain-containing protein [Microaerobacter geothermalis]MCF6092768.1 SH3 domain-containing protein [Microaerobacter geothermalis]
MSQHSHLLKEIGMILLLPLVVLLLLFGKETEASTQISPTVDNLNVRTGPGFNFPVLGRIQKGESYSLLEEQDQWVQIEWAEDKIGWVAGWLISKKESPNYILAIEPRVEKVNVRLGPSTSFQVIEAINPGETYPFVKEEGDWIQIQLNNNIQGWVAGWLVTKKETPPKATSISTSAATVNVPVLNVRSGPGVEYEKIGELKKGDTLDVRRVKEGWYQLIFNGQEGWVAGEYATMDKAAENSNSLPSPTKPIRMKVKPAVLNMRSGPSLESQVISKLNQGDILTVIQQKNDWFQVKTFDGNEGWVAGWLVTEISGTVANEPKVKILNPGTNIRSGPSTNNSVIIRANVGDTFPILGTEGDWFNIQLPDGKKGYVAGWIVAAEGIPNVTRPTISKYLKDKTIIVDPGHGGRDNGATGPGLKTLEKKVNLQVAKLLAAKLEAAGAKVVMTRTTDETVPLQKRVDLSIQYNADLFVSVHHNTNDDNRINGTITYYYTNGQDRELASYVQREVVKRNGLRDLKARKGNYFVLRENPRLAILVELGFLTNYNEEMVIRSKRFQEQSAEGIFQGILEYFEKNN